MTPELEVLEQLSDGPLSLAVLRSLFQSQSRFHTAIVAMLADRQIVLRNSSGTTIPEWQWQAVMSAEPAELTTIQVAITDRGLSMA